eukprot:7860691-Alexandrium_andersonii.AAC.1
MQGPVGLLLASVGRLGFRITPGWMLIKDGETPIDIIRHPHQQLKARVRQMFERALTQQLAMRR